PGGRADDYELAGSDFASRGGTFDRQLDLMHRAWRGDDLAGSGHRITPPSTRGDAVPVMIGGSSDVAVRRTVQWGVGWTSGGAPPQMAAQVADRMRNAWREAGKGGEPRLAALAYFSLGDDVEQDSLDYLRDYYEWLG